MTISAQDFRHFAHDSLNYVGRIQSVSDLLASDDEVDAAEKALIEQIINKDGANITKAIRLFCWWGWASSKPTLEMSQIDLAITIQELILTHAEERVNTDIATNLPEIKAEKQLLETIFMELLNNALLHREAESEVSLKLENTAGGIALSIKNKIVTPPPPDFEKPFIKQDGSTGMGIGLAMVAASTELFGMQFTTKVEDDNFVARIVIK